MKILILGLILLFAGQMLIAAESKDNKADGRSSQDRALAEQLKADEIKWLTTGDNKFLGIYKADTSGKALGSLLILAAPGGTAAMPGALSELAIQLSSSGWHTLGISIPDLDFSDPVAAPDVDKWYVDQETKNMGSVLERIMAAEADLTANGAKYVLLAQGSTAELVLELIASNTINPAGLISLNLRHPVYQQALKIPDNLARLQIPVLDIYNTTESESARKRKTRQKNAEYFQLYIAGSDNNFRGSEKLLVSRINGWLKKTYSKPN